VPESVPTRSPNWLFGEPVAGRLVIRIVLIAGVVPLVPGLVVPSAYPAGCV
jgi:hypothetical protein